MLPRRSATVALSMALVILLTFASSAFGNSRGQCTPNGRAVTNTTQFAKNLAAEGVTSQAAKVFRSAGYSPRDGSVATWLRRDTFVVKLAASARVDNYGCRGGKLFDAGKKTLRAGTPVVASLPPKYGKGNFSTKRTKKFSVRKVVKANFVGQTSCTNPGKGKVKVVIWIAKKPKPKPRPVVKPPKPQPPVVVNCPAGSAWNGTVCVVQTNTNTTDQTAEQSCKAIVNGTWNGNQCVIMISNTTIQINANCAKVTVNFSDGTTKVEYRDNNGNTVTESYCSTTVVNPPPVNPPPTDRAPQITVVGSPAHVYTGSGAYGWAEASDPDGDSITVTISASGAAYVAGVIPSNITWNGNACPTNTKCYRFTLWGTTPGTATITAKVTANGKSDTATATVPIVADEF